ncbi:MAG: glyoxalase [Thermoanaerobaculia bacterium]
MTITGLHHVQLAMPRGREDDARAFYAGVLGFTEVPKPTHLAEHVREQPVEHHGQDELRRPAADSRSTTQFMNAYTSNP